VSAAEDYLRLTESDLQAEFRRLAVTP